MSTADLIYEKAKQLSETQARSVLDYVVKLKPGPLTARELRRLPKEERQRLLAAQSAEAEALYQNEPALLNDCVDAPLDYGKADSR